MPTTEVDTQINTDYDKCKTTKEVSCLFTEFGRGIASPFLVIFDIWVVRVMGEVIKMVAKNLIITWI
jgi:hypothetical protein